MAPAVSRTSSDPSDFRRGFVRRLGLPHEAPRDGDCRGGVCIRSRRHPPTMTTPVTQTAQQSRRRWSPADSGTVPAGEFRVVRHVQLGGAADEFSFVKQGGTAARDHPINIRRREAQRSRERVYFGLESPLRHSTQSEIASASCRSLPLIAVRPDIDFTAGDVPDGEWVPPRPSVGDNPFGQMTAAFGSGVCRLANGLQTNARPDDGERRLARRYWHRPPCPAIGGARSEDCVAVDPGEDSVWMVSRCQLPPDMDG